MLLLLLKLYILQINWMEYEYQFLSSIGFFFFFFNTYNAFQTMFLAHLTQRVMWGIAITWRPLSVVRPLTFHILIYSSETTGPNGTKLGRKHLYKVLYKVSSFRPIPPTNMAAKGNSCFWLANVKKIFSSETARPNGAKLGRKHLCKILYKTSSFSSIRPTNMAAVTKNRTYGKIARFW